MSEDKFDEFAKYLWLFTSPNVKIEVERHLARETELGVLPAFLLVRMSYSDRCDHQFIAESSIIDPKDSAISFLTNWFFCNPSHASAVPGLSNLISDYRERRDIAEQKILAQVKCLVLEHVTA